MSPSWTTLDIGHRVLAVARTMTSLNRIMDVLPALADDPRIQVLFTVDEGSEFSLGVADHVRAIGARTIPWSTATTVAFDLVIAASDHSDLHQLTGPLLLVPHGAGYQKYSVYSDAAAGADRKLSGLAISALRHQGRPVPTRIGLSHDSQRAQLEQAAPGLIDHAAVIGDPCLDRLAMLARDRDRQRRLLGLQPWHSLVAVTSTWGSESTMGRWPTLPADLLAQLPYDEFRVAAILHPNVWAYHGSWQVEHWLKRARAAGLMLIPPTGPWQSVMAAADSVLGDHGSLSAYAAGLRRPLLLAAFGDNEVPAGTSMSELGKRIPRLVRGQPLTEQIQHAIATVDHAELDQLADQVFARRGQSLALLQDLMYELMVLTPPAGKPIPAAPAAESLSIARPRAFRVSITIDDNVARMRRFPATLSDVARPKEPCHLVATEGDPDERQAQNAAIVIADHQMTEDAAQAWGTTALARLPGCRIAAAPLTGNAVVAVLRDGRLVRTTVVTPDTDPSLRWDAELLSSALYSRLVQNPERTDLPPLVVTVGSATATVEFESI